MDSLGLVSVSVVSVLQWMSDIAPEGRQRHGMVCLVGVSSCAFVVPHFSSMVSQRETSDADAALVPQGS